MEGNNFENLNLCKNCQSLW